MMRRSPQFPEPKSPFLQALVAAFQKRSKAINHKVNSWSIEAGRDQNEERLNFDFDCFNHVVRFVAWEDQLLWFSSCKGSATNGWEVKFAFHASADGHAPQAIVSTSEEALLYRSDKVQCMAAFDGYTPEEDHS
ncbi:MAG: hypothetical protein AAFV45_09000 [Pseudomonadota bacterium]